MLSRRTSLQCLVLAVFVCVLVSLAPPPAAAATDPGVRHRLAKRVADARIGADVAMIVLDARTGQTLFARRPDETQQPASNMKIVTAVTSLARLGPRARFATTVLRGNGPRQLVLRGGGDPLLSAADLRLLARRTAAHFRRGTRVILHADIALFSKATRAPGWVGAYLGSSVGMVESLALFDDRSNHPSDRAVDLFAADLRSRGLSVAVGGLRSADPQAPVIARIRGHSLSESIASMLSRSDSSIAEILFRHVAIATGRPATWAGARRAAFETLAELGIDATGMVLVDGSGLSRLDRVSPRFLATVLRVAKIVQPQRFSAMFRPTALPIAGRSGTLATAYGRFDTQPSSCARGRVQAKTGTIMGTIALSGTVRTETAGPAVFAIIVNHRPSRISALSTRRALDGLAATIEGCWR